MKRWLVAGTLLGWIANAHAQAPGSDVSAQPSQQIAELRFRREAIRFGDDVHITVSQYGGSVHRSWFAMQGDLDERLEPEDFYRLVDRPDLLDEYNHRHNLMVGSLVVGGLGFAGALVTYVTNADATAPDDKQTAMLVMGGCLAVGAIGFGIGTWYHLHPHPISENEAKRLADEHNQALRRTLGLPVADVQLAPVATASSGGVALTGRF